MFDHFTHHPSTFRLCASISPPLLAAQFVVQMTVVLSEIVGEEAEGMLAACGCSGTEGIGEDIDRVHGRDAEKKLSRRI